MMYLRVYLIPIVLLLGAASSNYILNTYIPTYFGNSQLFKKISVMSEELSPWVTSALIFSSVISFLYQTYELWQWEQGKRSCCPNCGGMVTYRNGRYGPYLKCLHCGKNTRAW